jgi:hypothetical protein
MVEHAMKTICHAYVFGSYRNIRRSGTRPWAATHQTLIVTVQWAGSHGTDIPMRACI